MKKKQDSFELNDDMFNPIPKYAQVTPVNKTMLKSMTLLDKFERLIELAQGCRLEDKFFKRHKSLIESVAADLEVTSEEAVILCPFISDSENTINTREITDYFSCSPITTMRKMENLKALIRRRYIRRRSSFHGGSPAYQLSEKAKAAFCSNQSLPIVNTTNLTADEFMKHFTKLVREAGHNNQIDGEELYYETMELLSNNPQLSITRNINNLRVYHPDKVYLLYFCKRLVVDHQIRVPLGQLEFLSIDDIEDEFPMMMENGLHPFIKEGLLTPAGQDSLLSANVFQLTDKARKLFLSEYDIPASVDEVDEDEHSDILSCNDIKPKALFYSAEDQGQIDTLQHLLEDEQLQAIRERLEKANLRKGFNCLFYGGPGTGKTETALQLARMTGRDIMQVDISSIRDKWYGETEKIVKGIFESYAQKVKKSKRIPILLINEADAVLSVRTSVGGNNPTLEKTENAIQNILLQAMEDIDGIMIATTNLTCNLDSAFDRRFLYKVEFHQPSVEAKTHIWQSFIPNLAEADANVLARSYDFSGGQIENIARKVMVDHLLFGGTPDLNHIEELCSKEQIAGRNTNSRRPIGFRA
ncbi:MAG: ATP-binding protein [Bacteroidales bacterium]|nr:ATP-binding protein [Bacteroidales bacterium]